MINEKTNQLAKTALIIALIFVEHSVLEFPIQLLEDTFIWATVCIFLSVLILGKRDWCLCWCIRRCFSRFTMWCKLSGSDQL